MGTSRKVKADSPAVFGATRFNAAGAFAGVSFSPDNADLLALTPGESSSLVRRFSVPDGAVIAERVVKGVWRDVIELPDQSWVLASDEQVMHIAASGQERWRLTVGGRFAVSPDASRLVIFGRGDSAVFDVDTGKKLFDSFGAGKEIFAAAFSADSKTLATGSQDGTLRLLDARGQEIAKKKTTKILTLAFSPNENTLLSGHGNGDVLLWDVPTLRAVSAFRGAKHTFEGQGGDAGCRWMAFLSGGLIASLGNERLVRFWSIANGKEVRRIEVPARHWLGAPTALSTDGQHLAMGGTDGALSVWTTADGSSLVQGALPAEPCALALNETSVVVAGSSGFAAYRRSDGTLRELAVLFPPSQVLHTSAGQWLLIDHDQVSVLATFDAIPKRLCELGSYTSGAAAVSCDSEWLAAPIGQKVELRNTASGVVRAQLAHERSVSACAFFPGSDAWLVTATEHLHLWNLSDPPSKVATIALPEGATVHGLAVSVAGRIAVAYDQDASGFFSDRSALAFIELGSGKVTATLKRPGVRLGQVAFVGGAKVAITDSSGRLLLADGASAEWLDFAEGSDVHMEAQTIRALPLAVTTSPMGVFVAHLGADGNVLVRAIEPGAAETRQFELAIPSKVARPGSQGLFADRLRGVCVLIGGKFGTKETQFITETVKALGGTLATKASANVTIAAFAHPLYGKTVPSANEKAIDRLIADGAPITKLSAIELTELLLPTLEESREMLGGEQKNGIEQWNAWRARYPHAVFPAQLRGIDLAGADLRAAHLAGVHFAEAILEGVRLEGVDLFDAVFRGARMRGANLDGANCYRADFTDADLVHAKLNCDLTWARLNGAKLEGADLRQATIFNTELEGATIANAQMPTPKT